jgi:Tat protein secretion system quality control protein TatD with DNase activity
MDKFKIGDKIYKPKGYRFNGTIVSVFKTTSDETRIVAELDNNGMLHIFTESQLELRENCKHNFIHGTLEGLLFRECNLCGEKVWNDGLT